MSKHIVENKILRKLAEVLYGKTTEKDVGNNVNL